MNAVEFEAKIENGVVHIPPEFKDLQKNQKAKIIVIYDNKSPKKGTKEQLEEFRRLREKSNNKITVTMDLIKKLDEEMIDDTIF